MALLKTGQVAEILGIKHCEVRKLFEVGIIKGYSTPGGHRKYYSKSVYKYKDSIELKEFKYTLIYLKQTQEYNEVAKAIDYCKLKHYEYEIIKQCPTISLQQDSLGKIIREIEEEKIDRIIFGTFDEEEMLLMKCIAEIAQYHGVEIVYLTDIKEGFDDK